MELSGITISFDYYYMIIILEFVLIYLCLNPARCGIISPRFFVAIFISLGVLAIPLIEIFRGEIIAQDRMVGLLVLSLFLFGFWIFDNFCPIGQTLALLSFSKMTGGVPLYEKIQPLYLSVISIVAHVYLINKLGYSVVDSLVDYRVTATHGGEYLYTIAVSIALVSIIAAGRVFYPYASYATYVVSIASLWLSGSRANVVYGLIIICYFMDRKKLAKWMLPISLFALSVVLVETYARFGSLIGYGILEPMLRWDGYYNFMYYFSEKSFDQISMSIVLEKIFANFIPGSLYGEKPYHVAYILQDSIGGVVNEKSSATWFAESWVLFGFFGVFVSGMLQAILIRFFEKLRALNPQFYYLIFLCNPLGFAVLLDGFGGFAMQQMFIYFIFALVLSIRVKVY